MSYPYPPPSMEPPSGPGPNVAVPQGGYPYHPAPAGAWPPPAPHPALQQPGPAYPAHPGYPGYAPAPGVAAPAGYGPAPVHAGGYGAGYDPWGPRPATLVVRWLGLFLDGWGISILFYAVVFAMSLLGYAAGLADDVVPLIGLPVVFAAVAFYMVGTTAIWGRTPGKFLAGTQVVDIHTGAPPALGRTLLRTLVLGACWIVWPLLLVAAALATNNEQKRTWWDLAGRTRVIVYVRPRH